MWPWVAAVMAVLGTLIALANARAPARHAYAHEEYGMTARSHARFAVASGAFAAVFVAAAFVPSIPALPLLAGYVLLFVLYASSFARGFSDD